MSYDTKKIAPPGAVARVYWRHTMRYKWHFFASIASLVTIQIAAITGPLFLRQLINVVSGAHTPQTYHTATLALLGFAAAQAVIWVCWRVEIWAGTKACANIMADLTKEALSYLMGHSYQFFANSFAGALTRRIGRYSDSYNSLWDSFAESILPSTLYTLGIVCVLWVQNWRLGLGLAAAVAVFVAFQWIMSRWQQPLRAKRAEEDSALTGALADTISNHTTVQLFSGRRHEDTLVGGVVNRLLTARLATWNFDTTVFAIQSLISMSINVGLLWGALYLWQKGLLTLGDFILIQTYFVGMMNNVWSLGRQFRAINTAFADAGEMVYILNSQHEIRDRKGAQPLVVGTGEVWFDNVNFYFNKLRPVLKDFNLTIAGGERVALVGPSGAGKSTVTKLLLRLYDLPEGEVKIDKQDIAKVTQESLRNAISFVPQEPILFHRTLMENIRYGRRDATDSEVIEAAKKAHCHEFIQELTHGYDTYVGERGVKLSGGERQRVAIARAILKNAPILVLDEATSSLDSESEALIQDALETLMQGKTVIVIAHRLSTIMKMDRIVVMEGGRVVAQGTHLELIRERGLYQKLWSIQAGGFIGGDDAADDDTPEEDVLLNTAPSEEAEIEKMA